MFESAPLAMVTIDATGRIVLVNAESERLFGYERDELVGSAVEILVPDRLGTRHAELRDGYLTEPSARCMGAGRELFGRRRDGTEFPVEIGLNPVPTPEGLLVVAAIADITERQEREQRIADYAAELERANIELSQSNEDLEEFTRATSHDLLGPHAIRTLAEFIDQDAGEALADQSKAHLTQLVQRVDLMQRLLTNLREYSLIGRSDGDAATVNMQVVLQDVVSKLGSPPGFNVTVGTLPTIKAPREAITDVLLNLVMNSITHHDRAEGNVTVEAIDGGHEWAFVVEDDGPGIPEAFHERIFGVFETMEPKSSTGSTGIGLAIVRRIVRRHGGTVSVESSGRGSRFRFTWPK